MCDPKRIKRLKAYIERDEYFCTLITILDFLNQNENREKPLFDKKTIKEVIEDLMYLQENYRLVKK